MMRSVYCGLGTTSSGLILHESCGHEISVSAKKQSISSFYMQPGKQVQRVEGVSYVKPIATSLNLNMASG
jgi:hypothetical protein